MNLPWLPGHIVAVFAAAVLLRAAAVPLVAQELPLSATPRGVLMAFLNETASAFDSVDRVAFRTRLAGEAARTDVRSFKGWVQPGARVRIDSLPELPERADGLHRVAAYVTIETAGERESWYLFCVGDTIWRIEGVRRFPTPMQRAQIRTTLGTLDTANRADRFLKSELERSLLSDDSLRAMFKSGRADAERLLVSLRKATLWTSFSLRDVDFSAMEEYRELDDDVPAADLIFYTSDRGALERLKRSPGVRRIERDPKFPDLVFFVLGGLERGTFGYINAPAPEKLPELSAGGFITIKPVAPGWWFYKRVG